MTAADSALRDWAADRDAELYSIAFLSNPAPAGLPADFEGMGVLRLTEDGTGLRCTALVEHDYAVTALTAFRELEGFIPLAACAVRWLREGWPEQWGTPGLSPTWIPVYPTGGAA